MLKRFPVDPTAGIVAATLLILLVAGARAASRWNDLSFWREPGLLVALAFAGASASGLVFAYWLSRRRPGENGMRVWPEPPTTELQAQPERQEQPERQNARSAG